MYLKEHIVRMENIKIMQALDDAKINHSVIALFMSSEGIAMDSKEVTAILNTYDSLGRKKVPSKKTQALIDAKHFSQEDESLPYPV